MSFLWLLEIEKKGVNKIQVCLFNGQALSRVATVKATITHADLHKIAFNPMWTKKKQGKKEKENLISQSSEETKCLNMQKLSLTLH